MSNQAVDPKIVDRIRKLLALARDGGATENEAAVAMDRAQEIMKANSLSIAVVEAGGGTGEKRDKQQSAGRAHKPWMRGIMSALAESSFVYVDYAPGKVREDWDTGDKKKTFASYTLIGRESSVVQVQLMHEYLCMTVVRMARNRNDWPNERFMAGAGERIVERLKERHSTMLRQQREEAERRNREQAARAAHPGASSSSTALAVVLEDYAQSERDANDDLRWGREPGTTARARGEQAARAAARDRRYDELVKEGVDPDVAWLVAHLSYTLERALERVAREKNPEPPTEETDVQRARREKREERENAKACERMWRTWQKNQERRNNPSYIAGQAAGETVGLDTQVGQKETRKLS